MVEQALQGAEAELQSRAEALEGLLGSRPEVKLVADEEANGVDAIALTIMDEARKTGEPTLISVGSRGLGRVRRARVGSVSTKVVRAADGPVLFYPQLPEQPAASEGKGSFWEKVFDGTYRSQRQEKVLNYIIHRMGDGARLRDIVQEGYVRRLASPAEIEDILQNPRLVEAARSEMRKDLLGAEEGLRSG
jgi:hypothetical protein